MDTVTDEEIRSNQEWMDYDMNLEASCRYAPIAPVQALVQPQADAIQPPVQPQADAIQPPVPLEVPPQVAAQPPPVQQQIVSRTGLSDGELLILRDNKGFLLDVHIDAAQKLIKKSFPQVYGLFNPTIAIGHLSSSGTYRENYNQIINDNGNHWITMFWISEATAGVYTSSNGTLWDSTADQIASIMKYTNTTITIKMQRTKEQSNGYICGLYAIALATDIAYGVDPLYSSYDEDHM